MCLQVLVLSFPVASNFTAELTDDISASLAASYTLPDDAFVSSILVLEPVAVAPTSVDGQQVVLVDVPVVVLGNVSQAVGAGGVTAAALVSLFTRQLANQSFVSNSTGAVILAQSVTVNSGQPSSSTSSTGSAQGARLTESGSGLSVSQTIGIVVAVLVVTLIITAVYVRVYPARLLR